eukprot:765968-Hanusia_phi.AAC.7
MDHGVHLGTGKGLPPQGILSCRQLSEVWAGCHPRDNRCYIPMPTLGPHRGTGTKMDRRNGQLFMAEGSAPSYAPRGDGPRPGPKVSPTGAAKQAGQRSTGKEYTDSCNKTEGYLSELLSYMIGSNLGNNRRTMRTGTGLNHRRAQTPVGSSKIRGYRMLKSRSLTDQS